MTCATLLRWAERGRDRAELALRAKNAELESALREVRELRGLLPICAWCKSVRDVSGMWGRLEDYLSRHSRAILTHGICPDCLARVMAEEGDQGAGFDSPPQSLTGPN
jgi:hypothetical protein